MPNERWETLQRIFHAAAGKSLTDQACILAQECGSDAGMRDELRSMLESDGRTAPILDGHLAPIAQSMERETKDRLIGQTFGPYVPIRLLGEGGTGVVFLARRTDVGSVVALKVLRDAWISSERSERFVAEQKFSRV